MLFENMFVKLLSHLGLTVRISIGAISFALAGFSLGEAVEPDVSVDRLPAGVKVIPNTKSGMTVDENRALKILLEIKIQLVNWGVSNVVDFSGDTPVELYYLSNSNDVLVNGACSEVRSENTSGGELSDYSAECLYRGLYRFSESKMVNFLVKQPGAE